MSLNIQVFHQSLPLAQVFRISRGAKTSAEVVVVVISDGTFIGWGEAVPYGRYGESIDSVVQQIKALRLSSVEDHARLNSMLAPGSARNAVDCALWDLTAKIRATPVGTLLNLPAINSCITAQTISVDSAEKMHEEAKKLSNAPLIKVKLDADSVVTKMQAIHQVCPQSRFILDANEAWDIKLLAQIVEPLKACNVALIEQPLPADFDDDLLGFQSPIAICADESCHGADGLPNLVGKYNAINIKLDKTGGLTEAANLLTKAKSLDFEIMVGCMVGSSLAMAPAYTLCGLADYVDLDGPLLVAKDRASHFSFDNGVMSDIPSALWGSGEAAFVDPELASLSSTKPHK
ncbi:N-acetyl-D-Glu racemase DgcA [uncultured Paraglaciecola sp.]|uniref:N-acetyl-D-Glu racemase DgcA n=1 Tax=uncultured Paraglaciecola sp. TaxID=1765024 RepID=UPI002628F816|nr:N-acetyl-D-Glu racemase DgcA [uncultured Paraglaciecola sp.]